MQVTAQGEGWAVAGGGALETAVTVQTDTAQIEIAVVYNGGHEPPQPADGSALAPGEMVYLYGAWTDETFTAQRIVVLQFGAIWGRKRMKLAERIAPAWRSAAPQQRRRAGNIARFFAVLLVLTLVARGTAGATMPVVTVQAPSSGSVSQSIEATGTVGYTGGTPFTLPAGLLVTGVPVQQGQQVTAGDVLATFDEAELGRARRRQTRAVGAAADPGRPAGKRRYGRPVCRPAGPTAVAARLPGHAKTPGRTGRKKSDRARQKRNEAAQAVEAARNARWTPLCRARKPKRKSRRR